ncbi:MAG: AI-2E family transporter [Nitrospiraceae bacterium]|nr:AI-2E family transporter [Nitrospiraceae bacterium]
MKRDDRFFFFVLLFLIGSLGYLTYNIIKPFITPILWAIVFSIVFYPVYLVFVKWVRLKPVASLATLLLIMVVLLGPVSYVAYTLVSELQTIAQKAQSGGLTPQAFLENPKVAEIISYINSVYPLKGFNLEEVIRRGVSSLGQNMAGLVSGGAKNILQGIGNFILMLFSVFFLLKDGPDFIMKLRDYLPFSEKQKDRLLRQTKEMVVSTIFGGVLIALMQGIIGGLAFWAMGLSSPIFWGAAISIFSFLPLIGTAGIWAPAALYLLLTGKVMLGVIMILVGVLVISMIDNILRPYLIGGRMKMNTLVIFFSVLGGITVFGIIGFVLGPLTVALFLAVLEIFGNIEGGTHADPHGT